MPGATESYDEMKAALMEVVGAHFRPEFINRVDEIVVFHPLGRSQIRAITEIQIGYLQTRLEAAGIGLEITAAALDRLGEAGFDPVYGARPLKRTIRQQVENPLAQAILAGEFAGGDRILVDVAGTGLLFRKGAPETAVS
jgi:ATP-dependent Clp protease ATP-binding subunit ClpB